MYVYLYCRLLAPPPGGPSRCRVSARGSRRMNLSYFIVYVICTLSDVLFCSDVCFLLYLFGCIYFIVHHICLSCMSCQSDSGAVAGAWRQEAEVGAHMYICVYKCCSRWINLMTV